LIETLISIRIPELWVTPITEKYDIQLSCQVGGSSGKGGWGLATIRGDERILDNILAEIRNHPSVGGIKIQSREAGLVSFMVDVVRCKACEALIKSKAFMIFPVHIHKGRMKWLIITDDNRTIGKISKELEAYGCDLHVERITAFEGKGVLTSRQESVIQEALANGYFDYPRRTDSEELAERLGISVSTLSEIMRAAQRRVFAEYMQT
jgi:predicted DNA binding protein